MLPFQRNKVDLSKMSPQEQQLFAKYGKLPTHKSVLMKMQKERKYFDSGDYALSKAGVAPQTTVGTAIPNPENIPHANSGNGHNGHGNSLSISPTNSTSPVNRESGLATAQETDSADQEGQEDGDSAAEVKASATDAGQSDDAMVVEESTETGASPIASTRIVPDTTTVEASTAPAA